MHFRALRSRNFRLFFIGQSISLSGGWIQQAAMAWLVYRLTGSSALLGVSYFLSQAPVIFMAPLVPWLCSRVPRYKLFVIIQVISMTYAFSLAALAWSGHAQAWHILTLTAVAGCAMAMESPLRQGMLGNLVQDPADLSNAVLLNSLCINSTRLIGPIIAGALIATTGEAFCFLVNGFSYLAVIVAFKRMRMPATPKVANKPYVSVRQATAYAWARPRIRIALLLLVVLAGSFTPYFVVLPVYAKTIFAGDATTLGNLMSAAGVGCLLATLTLFWISEKVDLTYVTLWAALTAGVALAFFALNTNLLLGYFLLGVVGYGIILTGAALNIILQTVCEPRYRTSIMSLYAMAYAGVIPFASLALGWATHQVGTPTALHYWALAGVGGVLFLTGRLPTVRRRLRPLWRRGLPTLLSK